MPISAIAKPKSTAIVMRVTSAKTEISFPSYSLTAPSSIYEMPTLSCSGFVAS